MKIELARHVARTAMRAARELGELQPLLKEHAAQDYRTYAEALASVIDAIDIELLDRVTSEHPELEAEIDEETSTYGKYL